MLPPRNITLILCTLLIGPGPESANPDAYFLTGRREPDDIAATFTEER